MAIWLAIYAVALFALVLVVIGVVPYALFLIVVTEVIFLILRPQPKFGGSTYMPPAPAQWQPAITTLSWVGIINSVWVIGTTALALTIGTLILLVVSIIVRWHTASGASNFIVLVRCVSLL